MTWSCSAIILNVPEQFVPCVQIKYLENTLHPVLNFAQHRHIYMRYRQTAILERARAREREREREKEREREGKRERESM